MISNGFLLYKQPVMTFYLAIVCERNHAVCACEIPRYAYLGFHSLHHDVLAILCSRSSHKEK